MVTVKDFVAPAEELMEIPTTERILASTKPSISKEYISVTVSETMKTENVTASAEEATEMLPETTEIHLETAGGTIQASATEHPTVTSIAGAAVETSTTCSLQNSLLDIAFAINTETISQVVFDHIKVVISDFINNYLDLSPDITRVTLIKYSAAAEIPVPLGGYEEKAELLEKLEMLQRNGTEVGSTLKMGVNAAKHQFVMFHRPLATNIIIVFTHGSDM